MNRFYALACISLSVMSLSMTASEGERKMMSGVLASQLQGIKKFQCKLPIKPGQSLIRTDDVNDMVRVGFMLKLNNLNISQKDVHINIDLNFDLNWESLAKQVAEAQKTSESAGPVILEIDLSINKLAIAHSKTSD